MSEDRALSFRRRFRAGVIGGLVALTTSAAMPTAAAISVDVSDEVCSFQISEHDVLAATTAERKLQGAVVLMIKQRFPEVAPKVDYYHDRLSASTQDHGVRPYSGEVEHAEQRIDRAGRKAGFTTGELPRAIADAAQAGDSPGGETTLPGQAEHMQWHQEQAAAFLTFQPRSNAELAQYWPARSAGASQAMIDLELAAARSIDFLDHLNSMNTAYQACAAGRSGEFPVTPPPIEPSPAAIDNQLAAAELDDSEPAPTILARDGAGGAPAPAEPKVETGQQAAARAEEQGLQCNSLVALVTALLIGAAGFFLRNRARKTKP